MICPLRGALFTAMKWPTEHYARRLSARKETEISPDNLFLY